MEGIVLVMDYSAYERQKIRHIIEKAGRFDIIEVGDNKQFKLLNPDIEDLKLIVMNLAFPGETDGFDSLSRIRTTNGRNVPIIVMSQSERPELKQEALKYSVNDYIVKPYQIKRLENSIRSFLPTESEFFYDTGNISDIKMSFESYVQREIKFSNRSGAPLSLILITTLQLGSNTESDQSVSDEYKTSVFAMAARNARDALRATDTIVLNKNRDILIVLPCTDEAGARMVSEKIKKSMDIEFRKMNIDRSEYIYPVYVTFPTDGSSFQKLMQKAFKRISDKEMLEKIVSIPTDTRRYADKSYSRYRRLW
jgi:DNA-binding response OmpR family regulator